VKNRIRFAVVIAAVLLVPSLAAAQNRGVFIGDAAPVAIYPTGAPLGFVQIPLSGAAVGLSPPAGAAYALVSATGGNVNWRDDGTAPTTAVGMPIIAGQAPVALANLSTLQFIATSAQLNVSFYK
jgi:hypothetical protein